MNTSLLRNWSRPKAILVISTLTESPAHTLRVVSSLRTSGARLFLVQLPVTVRVLYPPDQRIPFLLPAAPTSFQRQARSKEGPAFLWAEILSEVTVLRNTPVERIPALVESLAADLVVLTEPETGRIPFQSGENGDVDLFGSLAAPILICGVRMKSAVWNSREPRKILMPVAFGPDLPLLMRFACRFARRHHAHLTVLHVFASQTSNLHAWERTPVAVEAQLPIAELKQEGILCPLEIAVAEGDPEQKILSFNQRRPHDLILMGGPRKRTSLRAAGDSVTEAVIAQGQCPVLVLGSNILGTFSGLKEPDSELSTA